MIVFNEDGCIKLVYDVHKYGKNNYKTFVNVAVGASQAITGISNLINLTKVWQDNSVSAGEKIKQTFTNIGMSLPLLINGVSTVIKNFKGFTSAIQLATLARQIDVTALKEQIIQ